ncbi:hypothetical protein [Clostridium formicaceticum]|uniref:Uncharacterized protein n=1 Tax=Clostridium formicaceticum TaxID=1497 RepID=A0AAC9RPL1_9CLOT|nr:hypothetical protein [Clostridium formicaceticum]AOY77439.1 hypothetical protein BJL90_17220 [Clostridium formicaceticum]ARE87995.1 hypothetical protein CLFO_23960 [Clostridium formicaceticum]
MNIFVKSLLLTLILGFALITKGMVERGLLGFFFLLIGIQYIKNKKNVHQSKINYKNIFMGAACGYLIIIVSLIYFRYIPKANYIATNYVSNQKTAIILVFQGEPTTYNTSLATKNFIENNSFWKVSILPFILFKEKLTYEKIEVAASVHDSSRRFVNQLREELGEDYNIYPAYLANTPYLIETIDRAVQEGNQRIIVSPFLLTECRDFIGIVNQVKRLNLQQYNVEPRMVEALWNSEFIAKSFVNQTIQSTVSPHKQNVGILLIGPSVEKREVSFPHIKQDILFREKIKDYLIKEGYNNNKIKLTFLQKRDIHAAIEGLMEYGVGEIILFLATTDLQQMRHYLTVEKIIEGLEVPYSVNIHKVDPWRFNDAIAKELCRRILLRNL